MNNNTKYSYQNNTNYGFYSSKEAINREIKYNQRNINNKPSNSFTDSNTNNFKTAFNYSLFLICFIWGISHLQLSNIGNIDSMLNDLDKKELENKLKKVKNNN